MSTSVQLIVCTCVRVCHRSWGNSFSDLHSHNRRSCHC